jgi:hypothetical protein
MGRVRVEEGEGEVKRKEVTATSSKLTLSSARVIERLSLFERIRTRRSRRNATSSLHIKLI